MPNNPKPRALRVVEGCRANRPLKAEPEAPAVEAGVKPLAKLTPEAQSEWDRVVPILAKTRIIGENDLALVTDYCVHWGHAQQAYKAWLKEGKPLLSLTGREHTLIALRRKAAFEARRCMGELGLSPVSRAKLGIEEKKTDRGDGVERFFA